MIKKRLTRLAVAVALVSAVVIPTAAQAAPASAATTATCRSQVFKYGSTGNCVSYIQTILNSKGLGSGTDAGQTSVDGIFGWRTHELVKRLQQKWAFTQDGIIGPNTWIALCSTNGGNQNAGQYFAGC